MRFSQLFGQTLREAPAGSISVNHQLLLRAAYMQQLGAGSFAFLHLGWLTLNKIKSMIRQELENLGGQQISLPALIEVDLEGSLFNDMHQDQVSHIECREMDQAIKDWDTLKLF